MKCCFTRLLQLQLDALKVKLHSVVELAATVPL
jgi:hypothetical protein